MNKISAAFLVLSFSMAACSSKKNNFDQVGKEEIKYNDGKVEIVNTKSLEQALDIERVKRESAERQAIAWKEDYEKAKQELIQARVALGLAPERAPCNPCKPGQITPSSSIQDELNALKKKKKKGKELEENEADETDGDNN
jgi:hypothetical protein